MPATYPGQIRVFTVKRNILDIVDAPHVNTIQEEVVALETTVGVNPHVSTAGGGSSLGAWSGLSRTYGSLSDRLANIEAGHLADTHSSYVRFAGTETITGQKTFSALTTFADIVVNGSATFGGSNVLTEARLSDALPSTASRTPGVATTVSRGDHSHGPSSTKGFTMTMMGA